MKILIADDDYISCRVLEITLRKWGHEMIIAENGAQALAVLQKEDAPAIAVLDWMMPEMSGTDVCRRVREIPSETPPYIILLTAKNQKEDVVAGLEAGADDYLTKPFAQAELRARIEVGIRMVSLQRKMADRVGELNRALADLKTAEAEIRSLSMTDDLTGLYNRRGFFAFAEQQQKLARRTKRPFTLVYADMDGLKQINDNFGHQEGSNALCEFASILKASFRDSDIVARLGGDEFTVCVHDCGNIKIPLVRLKKNLEQYNEQKLHPYEISVSIGSVCVNSDDDSPIEELLVKADLAMYANKRLKRRSSTVVSLSLQGADDNAGFRL